MQKVRGQRVLVPNLWFRSKEKGVRIPTVAFVFLKPNCQRRRGTPFILSRVGVGSRTVVACSALQGGVIGPEVGAIESRCAVGAFVCADQLER